MVSKRMWALLLVIPTLSSCMFTMEVKKSLPPPVVAVPVEPPPKILMVCDPLTNPELPPLPGAPVLSDEDTEDPTKVADALIDYVGSFNKAANERDQIRAKAVEDHRKSCRPMLDTNKTLPK